LFSQTFQTTIRNYCAGQHKNILLKSILETIQTISNVAILNVVKQLSCDPHFITFDLFPFSLYTVLFNSYKYLRTAIPNPWLMDYIPQTFFNSYTH